MGAIGGQQLAAVGFGNSGTALLNFVPVEPVQILSFVDQGDANWTDLDLTSYTSPMAVAVLLRLQFKDTAHTGSYLYLKKPGSSDVELDIRAPAAGAWIRNVNRREWE